MYDASPEDENDNEEDAKDDELEGASNKHPRKRVVTL